MVSHSKYAGLQEPSFPPSNSAALAESLPTNPAADNSDPAAPSLGLSHRLLFARRPLRPSAYATDPTLVILLKHVHVGIASP